MASSSGVSKDPLPVTELHPYPPPATKYEDLIISRELFMDTLKTLHATMRTKFMIPVLGGKDLDLFRLFAEVTVRGGMEKITIERRWKEVTSVFDFPRTATNASFVLRKYYASLLYHLEQIYFFKAREYSPSVVALLQNPRSSSQQLVDNQEPVILQLPSSTSELPSGSSVGSFVNGWIDAKFECGYLITVLIGSESLKGVLYLLPPDQGELEEHGVVPGGQDVTPAPPVSQDRRRSKKSETKSGDPALPKPNGSGFNFFFAEQHARLKPLHPGEDEEISRMIDELWNKMEDSERAVYQDQASAEMQDYEEKLSTGQVIEDAVPLQQCLPGLQVTMEVEETEKNEEAEDVDESNLFKCGSEDRQMAKESDENTAQMNINVETLAEEPGSEAPRTEEKEVDARSESIGVPPEVKDEPKGTD